MAVRDKDVDKNAALGRKLVLLTAPATATGQTALEVDTTVPGFAFEIEKVEVHATAVTATISADVQIGSTSVLSAAVTPVANAPTAGTLSSTLANIRGSSTDELRLLYTSNGTGAATALKARVWIRPIPGNGEVYSV